MKLGLWFFLSVMLISAAYGATLNCYNCTNCSAAITGATAGDTILLNNSLYSQSGTCISFGGKDNVTFDCGWNLIQGDSTGTDYGIYLASGSDNNTIVNCNISRFYSALKVSSKGNYVSELFVTENTADAFEVGGSYNYLEDITSLRNILNCGAYIKNSINSTFNRMTIKENNFGAQISGGYGNIVSNSSFVNNTLYYQFSTLASQNNIFRNNSFIPSQKTDIFWFSSTTPARFVHDIDMSNTVNGIPIKYWTLIQMCHC